MAKAAARSLRKSPDRLMCSQLTGEVGSNSAGTSSPAGPMGKSICQICRVPIDDRGDDEVQARGPEQPCLCTSLGDPPLVKCADHLGQRMWANACRCSLLFRPA